MSNSVAGLLASLLLLAAPADGSAEWKAGTARVVITPDQPMWMAGYGSRNHPSEGVLHDLWAKALAIEDSEGTKVVLITLDICGIGRDLSNAIRDALKERHGLERKQIVLACSHTHSGPVIGRNLIGMYPLDDVQRQLVAAYETTFRSKVIEAASRAIQALAPAELSWETGHCDFAVNRRNNNQAKAAELREQLALEGPVDHDMPVLQVRAGGQIKAIVCQYACHCTVLQLYKFSGDYAGFAQIALEAKHPGAQAMFVAGCGADQNPLPRSTVELAERYGAQLAEATEHVLAGAMRPVTGRLRLSYEEIELAFGSLPERSDWEKDAQSKTLAVANRAKSMLERLDRGGSISPTYPYPIEVWKLGDELLWVFLGGEVTVEYSLRLRRNLGSSHTWVAGYCNDVMAYIPSLRVLKEGGYEGGGAMIYYGLPAPWSERVEEQIIGSVREQASSLSGP